MPFHGGLLDSLNSLFHFKLQYSTAPNKNYSYLCEKIVISIFFMSFQLTERESFYSDIGGLKSSKKHSVHPRQA